MSKKNIATIILFILFFLGLIWIIFFEGKEEIVSKKENNDLVYDEIKGVWISYLELSSLLKGKTEADFKKNINVVIDNMKELNLNTMVVQVRPFSDAIYESKVFPWSAYCTGTEGKAPGFDPLEIMIKEAHEKGIRVEAWVNPYRIRSEGTSIEITDKNPAAPWINEKSHNIITTDNGIYYNPGSDEVRQLIVKGVEEIVDNYNIDGIHFDDYFYPTTSKDMDEEMYTAYVSGGGQLSLEQWRRENINILIKSVYKSIKSINPKVVFGISPQGSMDNNYNNQYIDVKEWVQNLGYIDYICPQIYYGFKNENSNFEEVVNEFDELITEKNIKLYVGLAAYKVGKEDTWAGVGKNEWIEENNILSRQIAASRKAANYKGVIFFRYDSLFNPTTEVAEKINKEVEEIKLMIK